MTDIDPLPPLRRFPNRRGAAVAALGLLLVGGGAGAVAIHATRPTVSLAPVVPVAIRALAPDSIATIKGRVVEIFGNKFILADASGRALVDTGPQGEDDALVTTGEPVTIQGRFDHGFLHAAFLIGPDNKVTSLAPPDGPRHGRHDRGHGPEDGPADSPERRNPDISPPPAPPPVPEAAPAAPSSK